MDEIVPYIFLWENELQESLCSVLIFQFSFLVSVSEIATVFSGYGYWVGRLKLGEFTRTQLILTD